MLMRKQNIDFVAGTKECSKCKRILSLDNFGLSSGVKSKLHSWCKECCFKNSKKWDMANAEYKKQYKKKYLQTQRQLAADYLGGKCQSCGYNESLAALEFHHLNPKLKDRVVCSNIRSFESLKEELDKCILLCANCHRRAHAGEIKFGKNWMEMTKYN